MKIGIVGAGGFVGQAVYGSIFPETKPNVALYDPAKFPEESCWEDILECTHLFMCLPTPMRTDHNYGTQDFSIYDDVLCKLIRDRYKGIVIIKSTVLYENIEPYLSKLNIVMNPEFLNARSAREDFRNQRLVILGGRVDHTESVEEVYEEHFMLVNEKLEYIHCSHKEAIEAKYFHNCVNALKVLIYHTMAENVSDYRKMFDIYAKLRGTTEALEMARICADSKHFGANGACLLKDLEAFNTVCDNAMLRGAVEYNRKLAKR